MSGNVSWDEMIDEYNITHDARQRNDEENISLEVTPRLPA